MPGNAAACAKAAGLPAPGHDVQYEFEDGLLTKCVGDDQQPRAFINEKTFEEIGRADRATMGDRNKHEQAGAQPAVAVASVVESVL